MTYSCSNCSHCAVCGTNNGEYEDDIRVLLENNAVLTRTVANAPEYLEAMKIACNEERVVLRAALKEALDEYDTAADDAGPPRDYDKSGRYGRARNLLEEP